MGFLTNKWMLAKLSFTLSKHWFCHYKPACTSVHHTQQALLLDAHPLSLLVSATLSKHRIWTSKTDLPRCPSVLASIADVMTLPASFELSFILSKHRIWLSILSLAVDYSWQASRLDAHPRFVRGVSPNPTRFPK